MDPINVDFGGEKIKSVEPKGSTLKRVIISLLITIVLGAAAYYAMLPALNFKAFELYLYLGVVLFIYIGVFGVVSKAYFRPEYMEYAKNKVKIPIALILVLVFVLLFISKKYCADSLFRG